MPAKRNSPPGHGSRVRNLPVVATWAAPRPLPILQDEETAPPVGALVQPGAVTRPAEHVRTDSDPGHAAILTKSRTSVFPGGGRGDQAPQGARSSRLIARSALPVNAFRLLAAVGTMKVTISRCLVSGARYKDRTCDTCRVTVRCCALAAQQKGSPWLDSLHGLLFGGGRYKDRTCDTCRVTVRCCALAAQQKGNPWLDSLQAFYFGGGRYKDRTCDTCRVKAVLYR